MDPEVLTDRIRELCARAIMTPSADIEPVISELQAALHEHNLWVRDIAAKSLVRDPIEIPASVSSAKAAD